ncbi:MAG: hypothetical protein C0404_03490 [Verrucomicrobia bacterium]|nr:hypothetical protein [Verrucomicrobiota bacterium]
MFVALSLTVAFPRPADAEPYDGREFTYSQPDGTTFKIRLFGDEFYAVEETLDGYVVVRDTNTWFFCYAELDQDGKAFVPAGKEKKLENRVGKTDPEKLGLKKHIRESQEIRKEKAQKRREEARVDRHGRPLESMRPKKEDKEKDEKGDEKGDKKGDDEGEKQKENK